MLDNPAWHALTGPQQKVADLRSGAARYIPDVAAFAYRTIYIRDGQVENDVRRAA